MTIGASRVTGATYSGLLHVSCDGSMLTTCLGRWNYIRTCKYTVGTFWKEMLFYLTQALYQRYAGYTGTSLYESWSLSMFNTLYVGFRTKMSMTLTRC